MFEYRTVPFAAGSSAGSSSQQRRAAAAEQFQYLLASQMAEGYHLIEQPGCLRAFFGFFFGGGGPIVLAYDVAVFRRQVSP